MEPLAPQPLSHLTDGRGPTLFNSYVLEVDSYSSLAPQSLRPERVRVLRYGDGNKGLWPLTHSRVRGVKLKGRADTSLLPTSVAPRPETQKADLGCRRRACIARGATHDKMSSKRPHALASYGSKSISHPPLPYSLLTLF